MKLISEDQLISEDAKIVQTFNDFLHITQNRFFFKFKNTNVCNIVDDTTPMHVKLNYHYP